MRTVDLPRLRRPPFKSWGKRTTGVALSLMQQLPISLIHATNSLTTIDCSTAANGSTATFHSTAASKTRTTNSSAAVSQLNSRHSLYKQQMAQNKIMQQQQAPSAAVAICSTSANGTKAASDATAAVSSSIVAIRPINSKWLNGNVMQ